MTSKTSLVTVPGNLLHANVDPLEAADRPDPLSGVRGERLRKVGGVRPLTSMTSSVTRAYRYKPCAACQVSCPLCTSNTTRNPPFRR
jgi:hypothetical protein